MSDLPCGARLVSGFMQRHALRGPLLMCLLMLQACASQPLIGGGEVRESVVPASYLSSIDQDNFQGDSNGSAEVLPVDDRETVPRSRFQPLKPLRGSERTGTQGVDLAKDMSGRPDITVSVEEMALPRFIHYVFGELLSVNYIIDEPTSRLTNAVTLSFNEPVSARHLLNAASNILSDAGVGLKRADGTYLLFKISDNEKKVASLSIGGTANSVPNIAGDIMHVVPLKFGSNITLERTLRQLTDLEIQLDVSQGGLFLVGERSEIVKAIGLVEIFDAPSVSGRHVGLISLTFVEAQDFTAQLQGVLEVEGLKVSLGAKVGANIILVPLPQLGATAVFSASEDLLARVQYWADVLDQPTLGAEPQYFTYTPKLARASDMGESLGRLLGSTVGGSGSRQSEQGGRTGQAPSAARTNVVSTDELRMVVDDRSNSLVFITTGTKYRTLLPLLNQLDILPKQVMLDVVIAEVSLKDEFKFGFEWALRNDEGVLSTLGGYGASGIGGMALSLSGTDGELVGQVLQTSSLVKVLSNPSFLVRDGVEASIDIGSDIAVVGSTTFDPLVGQRQTTNAVYRKTGVSVSVTPTVNAEDIVIMSVSQNISNALPGSVGASGNPDIFERSITTEVVAQSGQTVLLGGLVSEDVSNGESGTPGLSKLPGLGRLFKSSGDTVSRTELVMLITPRVLESVESWNQVKNAFKDGLEYLSFPAGNRSQDEK